MEYFELASIEHSCIAIVLFIIVLIDTYRTFNRSIFSVRLCTFFILNIIYTSLELLITYLDEVHIANIYLLYFICAALLVTKLAIKTYLFLCTEYVIKSSITRSFKLEFFCLIPSILTSLLVITSPFTKWIFKFHEDTFSRGQFFFIYQTVSLVYVAACIVHAFIRTIKTKNINDNKIYLSIIVFLTIPYIISIFDEKVWTISVALAVLSFYLIIQHDNLSKDALTKLNSRQYLKYDILKMISVNWKSRLCLLMIDGDYFKKINDNYGHLEGDKSLIRIGEAISYATRNLYNVTSARYGGDEFVVCFYENGENTASHIANQIKEKVVELNLKDDSPYDLTVSIGIAYYDSSIKSVDDFINAADMKLYEHKKGRT